MAGLKSVTRLFVPLLVVCGALFVANCGGSGSSSTPSGGATSGPQSLAITLIAANETIPLPAVSDNLSVTLNYAAPTSAPSSSPSPTPFPTGGVSLTTTVTAGPVSGAPALTSRTRAPLSKSNATVVLSVQFSLATPLPSTIFPSETLNFGASTPQNVPYFVEIDDLTTKTYVNTYPGNAFANGQVLFTNSGGFIAGANLPGGQYSTDSYLMQFYYLGTGASPSPTPSPNGSSPAPSPSPVVVATNVPLTAGSVTLPVTAGGFVGTVAFPSTVGGASVAISAQSALPPGISAVGTGNVYFPFYSLVLSASATAATTSPGVTLQLPTSFSTVNQIQVALCSSTDCSSPQLANTTSGTQNGAPTAVLAPGAFTTFAGYSTAPQSLVFVANRSNSGSTTTLPIPANGSASANVAGATFPNGGGQVTSSVTLGTASAATTATINAQAGLLGGINTVVPNNQTVFYSLGIIAMPAITFAGGQLSCGANCVTVTLPSTVVSATAGLKYYVEQCSASGCPVPAPTSQPLTLSGSNTLTASSAQIGSVAGLGATPVYLVFFAQ